MRRLIILNNTRESPSKGGNQNIGIFNMFAFFDWDFGPGRGWKIILSLGATFSQSFGAHGATCTPFVSIFMIFGDLICVHVSQCQPEAVNKL